MRALGFAIGVTVLCACGVPPSTPAMHVPVVYVCRRKPVHITMVGDSLAKGWGAQHPQNTLAGRIYAFVRDRRPGTTLRNLGIPGATTEEVARHQAALLRSDPCSLIVVLSGANDVQKWYTPAHISRSYSELLRDIRTHDPPGAIVAVGLPNVALSDRIPWYLKPVESALSKSTNASIVSAAQRYGAAVVPLYSLSLKNANQKRRLLSADGLHPNDEGYALMADAVYPSIATLLEDAPTRASRR